MQLNPHVLDEAKSRLGETGFCRVADAFPRDQAGLLTQELQQATYKIAFTRNGQAEERTEEQIRQMPSSERKALYADIIGRAANGVGFLYGRHFIDESSSQMMQEFLSYWNSRELLDAFTEISGQKIVRASAQATCYDKANFLTRHNDVVPSEGRVYAYVLGMTEKWHPDWGGLLQFYRRDGTPTESHAPAHNSLTLFDVHKIHAVTYVAPFANARRYSITGWFRTS